MRMKDVHKKSRKHSINSVPGQIDLFDNAPTEEKKGESTKNIHTHWRKHRHTQCFQVER